MHKLRNWLSHQHRSVTSTSKALLKIPSQALSDQLAHALVSEKFHLVVEDGVEGVANEQRLTKRQQRCLHDSLFCRS